MHISHNKKYEEKKEKEELHLLGAIREEGGKKGKPA